MIDHLNWTATIVFVGFFALVTIMGFLASSWKSGDLTQINEWGLGGRQFGSWITWFLLGGDLYTAYTVIAVPALVYAIGAYGFFAVPYTVIVYPLIFLIMPRLWNVSARKGYVTAGDFVYGRYGNKGLELAANRAGVTAGPAQVIKVDRPFREPRPHAASAEELTAHEAFVGKIKNAIWLKTE